MLHIGRFCNCSSTTFVMEKRQRCVSEVQKNTSAEKIDYFDCDCVSALPAGVCVCVKWSVGNKNISTTHARTLINISRYICFRIHYCVCTFDVLKMISRKKSEAAIFGGGKITLEWFPRLGGKLKFLEKVR